MTDADAATDSGSEGASSAGKGVRNVRAAGALSFVFLRSVRPICLVGCLDLGSLAFCVVFVQ